MRQGSRRCQMNEVPTLVTSCINCFTPGNLSATLAVILIGAGIAWTAERRKLARVRSDKYPAHQVRSGAEPCLSFLVLECCSRRRPQLDTVRHLAGRDQAPQRYQQLARP